MEHGGTAYDAWVLLSYIEMLNEYKGLIEKLFKGELPKLTSISLKETNKSLNNAYKKLLKLLDSLPEEYGYFDKMSLSTLS